MASAAGAKPSLTLLFVAHEKALENSPCSSGLRTLLDGLSERGMECPLICHVDPVSDPAAANTGQPGSSPVSENVAAENTTPDQPDADNTAADKAAYDKAAAELVELLATTLEQQPADVVVLHSEAFAAPLVELCRERKIPLVVLWEGGDPRDPRALADAAAILTPTDIMADYLRDGYGVPAVCLPPLISPSEFKAAAPADQIVFDGATSEHGLTILAGVAAAVEARRPNAPVAVVGPGGVFLSSTAAFAKDGVDAAMQPVAWDAEELWSRARVFVTTTLDWRDPAAALRALSHGVPILAAERDPLIAWFGEAAQPLPLNQRSSGGAAKTGAVADVSAWVDALVGLFSEKTFAARRRKAAANAAARFPLDRCVEEYAQFFRALARSHSDAPHAANSRPPLSDAAAAVGQFAAAYPWPGQRPAEVQNGDPRGPAQGDVGPWLARSLAVASRLVLELGAGAGWSTQRIAQQASSATVVCVDDWKAAPAASGEAGAKQPAPKPYEEFLYRCWDRRPRIVPVRQDRLGGMKLLADAGLQPDFVYVHPPREAALVAGELQFARQAFPQAALLGSGYDDPPVREAVCRFARAAAMVVERQPGGGWGLLERWRIAAASQPPPGRGSCAVLVPHLNGIEFECEQSLRHLEAAGVRVIRRGGCSAIDAARNDLASEALHEGMDAILFIDADIGFDPQDAMRLLARPEDVVTGVYAKKGQREMASLFAENVNQVQLGAHAKGLYPLKFAAAGFLRIRSSVLRRMIADLKLPLCNTHWGRGMWPFFQPMIVPHPDSGVHYLGEDWAFSHRLREIGVTPLADTSIRLWHWGRYGFSWEDAGQDTSRFDNYTYNL